MDLVSVEKVIKSKVYNVLMKIKVEQSGKDEWLDYFRKVFKNAKERFREDFPFKDDGDVSPDTLALRDAIFNLPIPIDIVDFDFSKNKPSNIKDDICQIVKYDFTQFGKEQVTHLGPIEYGPKNIKEILLKKFSYGQEDDFIKVLERNLNAFGYWAENVKYLVEFYNYNIFENFDRFSLDFYLNFRSQHYETIVKKFKKDINFNEKFNLKPDEILPLTDLIQPDPSMGIFVRGDHLGITIEDLQRDICNIQLIPNVNEHVKRVFDGAKKLYVYGYFNYYFFTISQHYAYLALESAIQNRYIYSFGEKIILENKTGTEKIELRNPGYSYIFGYHKIKKDGKNWNPRVLKINGQEFLNEMGGLLNWLADKQILTKWEVKRCRSRINMRNILSHLSFATIFSLNKRSLESVAYYINKIYFEPC